MLSFADAGGSSAISGIGSLHHRGALRSRWFRSRVKPRVKAWIGTGDGFQRQWRRSDCALRRLGGGQNLLMVVHFQLRYLRLNLGFELVRGSAELIQSLAHLTSDFRQLLGPKDDQGQEKQEDGLRKTHGIHHTAPA